MIQCDALAWTIYDSMIDSPSPVKKHTRDCCMFVRTQGHTSRFAGWPIASTTATASASIAMVQAAALDHSPSAAAALEAVAPRAAPVHRVLEDCHASAVAVAKTVDFTVLGAVATNGHTQAFTRAST